MLPSEHFPGNPRKRENPEPCSSESTRAKLRPRTETRSRSRFKVQDIAELQHPGKSKQPGALANQSGTWPSRQLTFASWLAYPSSGATNRKRIAQNSMPNKILCIKHSLHRRSYRVAASRIAFHGASSKPCYQVSFAQGANTSDNTEGAPKQLHSQGCSRIVQALFQIRAHCVSTQLSIRSGQTNYFN